jgi:hypothetical protein
LKINVTQFRNEYNTASKKRLTKYAFDEAKIEVDKAKKELIDEFKNHEYSKEIADGEHASNSSSSLGGKGNLFSFIGFEQGSEPVDWVTSDLKENIGIRKFAEKVVQRKDKTIYTFEVVAPTFTELDERHPMPEWTNKGWMSSVRRGISGFRSYIYWKMFDPEVSRSTTGVQAKKGGKPGAGPAILRAGSYKAPLRYLSEMLQDFKNKFKGNV